MRTSVLLFSLVSLGCASTVSQDANSGDDARVKGAKKVRSDGENRWRDRRDIVTYPGGDRVDWKVLEIPEKSPRGTLEIRVDFDLPRPGLDLAFDVFDGYHHRIARARKTRESKLRDRETHGNHKKVSIANVGPGHYFVAVYAPRRTDAARYRVTARFVKSEDIKVTKVSLPAPPALPAVPDPDTPIRPKKPVTPTTKPEPVPCALDASRLEPDCPRSLKATIKNIRLRPDGRVQINIGSKAKLEKGWKGRVVDSKGRDVPGGSFTIVRVTENYAVGIVTLSVDQADANRRIIITAD